MSKTKCVACKSEEEDMGHILLEGKKVYCCLTCYKEGKVAIRLKKTSVRGANDAEIHNVG